MKSTLKNATKIPPGPPLARLTVQRQATPSVDRLRAAVRKTGGRLTGPTLAVFRVLAAQQRPLTIEEIQHGCRMRSKAPHVVSLYRITRRLEELDVVHRVLLGDGLVRYEVTAAGHHHHVVCTLCGKITELDVCGMDVIEKYVRDVLRFRQISHELEYKGICRECQ